MNSKGMTLIELLIVIVVLGIISAFAINGIGALLENTKIKVDVAAADMLEETIKRAHNDGVLIIQNNKLYNTRTERGYSGTGNWFYDDMVDYQTSRLVPEATRAENKHNKGGESYKFLFNVKNDTVTIFYYDSNKKKINLTSFEL